MGDRSRWGEVAIGRSLLQKRGWFPSNKSRDREIAPTVGVRKSRDREIAPTGIAVSGQKESRSGDRSYSWSVSIFEILRYKE